jgi:amidase
MSFILEEATITNINSAFKNGEITSKELVMMYLERIARIDKGKDGLNSILEINPDALFIAEAMDIERASNGQRSPLHGIPVLIKDNINTCDKCIPVQALLPYQASTRPMMLLLYKD